MNNILENCNLNRFSFMNYKDPYQELSIKNFFVASVRYLVIYICICIELIKWKNYKKKKNKYNIFKYINIFIFII